MWNNRWINVCTTHSLQKGTMRQVFSNVIAHNSSVCRRHRSRRHRSRRRLLLWRMLAYVRASYVDACARSTSMRMATCLLQSHVDWQRLADTAATTTRCWWTCASACVCENYTSTLQLSFASSSSSSGWRRRRRAYRCYVMHLVNVLRGSRHSGVNESILR